MKKKHGNRVLTYYTLKKTLRIMRIVLFLLLLSIFQAIASVGHSQITKITLKSEDLSLENVLERIEEQSEYRFIYDKSQIDLDEKIKINFDGATLKEVMETLFARKGVAYQIIGNQVVLTALISDVLQQQKSISGKVTDSNGQPLPGVTVVVKGTTQGIVTNAEGEYTLTTVPANATLQFSFVGMKTQEIPITGKSSINVIIVEDAIGLEEVVAIGYGVQKKENLTGAISQVKVDNVLRSRPVSNVASAIQGSMPGVQITTSSGRPGEDTDIDIRGVMSINGGSPLVLVDNVPMDINDLNPSDIETISVLKDAAASSIYGGRAAFGVILITTKKASRNRPIKFDYTCNFTISQPSNLPQKASIQETVQAYQDWGNTYYPGGQSLSTWKGLLDEYISTPSAYPDGETYIDGTKYRLAETNLYDMFMQNSFEQMHNFSFSGGTEKTDYRVSFGYVDEDGIMITDKDSYSKYNMNVYLNTSLSPNLTSTVNVLYKNDKRLTPPNYSGLFTYGLRYPSFMSTGYTDDGIPYATPDNYLNLERANPVTSDDLRIFEKLEYAPVKGLKVTGEYTYIKGTTNTVTTASGSTYMYPITDSYVYYGDPSYYYCANSKSDYHALNLYASYDMDFNDHKLKVLVGTNLELSKYSSLWAKKTELMDLNNPSLETALGTMTNGESASEYAISGYFSRINYSYKNKYLLEANVRYDGSSKFPEGDRYGFFPSFSGGWIITEEPFMESVRNIVSFAKIRGSWGEIGNQSIDNYAYIPSLSTSDASWIDPSSGILALTINPPDLVSASFSWETVRTKNIGIDINFFDDRLNANFDYYQRETLDMLGTGAELPSVLGAEAPEQNVANLESKGWDLGIEWRVKKSELSYSVGFNISDNRAYVTKYDNESGILSQYYDGYEFGQIWGYVTDGFFTTDDFETGTLDEDLLNGTLKSDVPAYYTVISQNPRRHPL